MKDMTFQDYIMTGAPELVVKEMQKQASFNPTNRVKAYSAMGSAMQKHLSKFASTGNDRDVLSLDTETASVLDEGFRKVAAIIMNRSTPEDIATYLKEYMYNELSFFPERVQLNVSVQPLAVEENEKNTADLFLKDATGTLDITYNGVVIQIPWMMRDKEILPFDAIMMGSETAIYTRDNLKNILFNLRNMQATKAPGASPYAAVPNNPLNPFVSTDKYNNTLTDYGFMGDMLNIQSAMANAPSGYSDKHVHASSLEEVLEKTASIKVIPVNETEVRNKLISDFMDEAEKMASPEDVADEYALDKQAAYEHINKRKYVDISVLENGEKILFTEINGDILDNTPGVVYKNVISMRGVSPDSLVVAGDTRFKVVKPGEKFLANADDDTGLISPAPFNLKTISIDALNPGRLYTALVNGTPLLPFAVLKTTSGDAKGLKVSKIYICMDIEGRQFNLIPVSNVMDNMLVFQPYKATMGKIAEFESSKNLIQYEFAMKKQAPVLCVSEDMQLLTLDPDTKLNNIGDPREITFAYDDNVKLAFTTDNLKLTLENGDKERPLITIRADWFDSKFNGPRFKELTGLNENKAINMLQKAGYDYAKASEVVFKFKNEGYYNAPLMERHCAWMMRPDMTAAMAADRVIADTKESLFNAKNAVALLGGIGAGALGATLAGKALGTQLAQMKRFAEESAALSVTLEKNAMSTQSKGMLKLAGYMTVANRAYAGLASALEGNYVKGMETLSSVKGLRGELEKLASDLVELKVEQALKRNEIISPIVVTATLRHLDSLYKIASLTGVQTDIVNAKNDSAIREQKNFTTKGIETPPTQYLKGPVGDNVGKAVDALNSPVGTVATLVGPGAVLKKFKK